MRIRTYDSSREGVYRKLVYGTMATMVPVEAYRVGLYVEASTYRYPWSTPGTIGTVLIIRWYSGKNN